MTTDELEIWRTLNECECVKEVFGKWVEGDLFYDPYNEHQIVGRWNWTAIGRNLIWIPLLYDPISPERSLWGMSEEIRDRKWSPGDCIIFASLTDRPDLALAKAIIEMEETK